VNGVTCALTGRVGGDPDLAYGRDGRPRLGFSVAVDEHTAATEERPTVETTWVRCTVWGDLAETLAEQLHKGSAVYCEGRLRLDKWLDRGTDVPRSGLSVSAWRCEVHGAIGKAAPRRGWREPTAAGDAAGFLQPQMVPA
jgi:single stranded DNA-binding protein